MESTVARAMNDTGHSTLCTHTASKASRLANPQSNRSTCGSVREQVEDRTREVRARRLRHAQKHPARVAHARARGAESILASKQQRGRDADNKFAENRTHTKKSGGSPTRGHRAIATNNRTK
jgi:hypothetical protein